MSQLAMLGLLVVHGPGGPCYFFLRLLAFVEDPLGQSLCVVIGHQSSRHLFATLH